MFVVLASSLSLTLLHMHQILNRNHTRTADIINGGTASTTTTANRVCGSHGSHLIDTCICEPGYEGESCEERIPRRGTKCQFDPNPDVCWNVRDVGRFRVASRERQQQAFSCETDFWETTSIPVRNQEQLLAFERFRGLPRDLGEILEIGAGPYTKTKLILENQPDRQVSHVTLLDPLIEEYMTNRKINTSYPDRDLVVNGVPIPTSLVAAGGEDPLPVCRFDTVILVNTLEHCFNAVVVLNNAYQSLKEGGILIFGESFAQETMLQTSDACHPIQLMQGFLVNYLTKFKGVAILPPRCGDAVKGVTHPGVRRTLFAILRKA
jgi:SAM-dependent methyltransferase